MIRYLNHFALLQCVHGGTVLLPMKIPRSFNIEGSPVLTDKDLLNAPIIGCAQFFLPCTKITKIILGKAEEIEVDGQAPLLELLVAATNIPLGFVTAVNNPKSNAQIFPIMGDQALMIVENTDDRYLSKLGIEVKTDLAEVLSKELQQIDQQIHAKEKEKEPVPKEAKEAKKKYIGGLKKLYQNVAVEEYLPREELEKRKEVKARINVLKDVWSNPDNWNELLKMDQDARRNFFEEEVAHRAAKGGDSRGLLKKIGEEVRWRTLTREEEIQFLDEVAKIYEDVYGFPRPEIRVEEEGILGIFKYKAYYSPRERQIKINQSWLNLMGLSDGINVVCHEMTHAYQHVLGEEFAQNRIFPDDPRYAQAKITYVNWGGYIESKESDSGYRAQPMEKHARYVGEYCQDP